MSHSIIYNRLFIKAKDKDGINYYSTILLSGANNCTQTNRKGREIRERSWQDWKYFTNGKLIATEQDILTKIDEERLDRMKRAEEYVKEHGESWAYNDKNFGYHASIRLYGHSCSGTSFSAFRSYFENGMKKALTIEELLQNNIQVKIYVSSYWKDEINKAGLEIKPDVYPKTSEEFLEKANEYGEYYKNTGGCFTTFTNDWAIDRYFSEKKLQNKIKRQNNRAKKIRKEVEKYFILSNDKGFFVKLTRNGYRYCYDSDAWSVKKWAEKKEAEKYLRNMNERRTKAGWEVVEIRKKVML